jgi:hypothetical protein
VTDAHGRRAPSATVVVHVFPMGPGQVLLEVSSAGPVRLTPEEMVRTLRTAADQLESGQSD